MSLKLLATVLSKSQWHNNLKSDQKNPRLELPERGVNTLSNRYNGAGLMFLFKESLSLIIRKISFNFKTNFLGQYTAAFKRW